MSQLTQHLHALTSKFKIYRQDFFQVEGHGTPVRFKFRCKLCQELHPTDSDDCQITDSIWSSLYPHLIDRHNNFNDKPL